MSLKGLGESSTKHHLLGSPETHPCCKRCRRLRLIFLPLAPSLPVCHGMGRSAPQQHRPVFLTLPQLFGFNYIPNQLRWQQWASCFGGTDPPSQHHLPAPQRDHPAAASPLPAVQSPPFPCLGSPFLLCIFIQSYGHWFGFLGANPRKRVASAQRNCRTPGSYGVWRVGGVCWRGRKAGVTSHQSPTDVTPIPSRLSLYRF